MAILKVNPDASVAAVEGRVPADVLILTSRPQEAALWRAALSMRGYGVTVLPFASSTWLDEVGEAAASVVVLDSVVIEDVAVDDLRRLRQQGDSGPCVVVVAPGEIETRVRALDAGADACLLPAVGAGELVARLAAILRRTPFATHSVTFSDGNLALDIVRRVARFQGRQLALSQTEFQTLRDLALQVMECRARFANSPGDDRLSSALYRLHGYVEDLDQRSHHQVSRGSTPTGPEPS
ncbi:MAG: response regulator transcription factor [Anaerolineae bacterium]